MCLFRRSRGEIGVVREARKGEGEGEGEVTMLGKAEMPRPEFRELDFRLA